MKIIEQSFKLIKESNRKCQLYIGITDYYNPLKNHYISPYINRKIMMDNKIRQFISKYNINNKKLCYKIIKIKNIFGISLINNYKYIIVSEDTKKNAILINKIRKLNNKNKIKIITIPLELDNSNTPISTTNILNNIKRYVIN